MEALSPQKPGRKPKSSEQVEIEAAREESSTLKEELATWKMKYEIAKAYLDLERKYDRGEPLPGETPTSSSTKRGKKKTRRRKRKRPTPKKR